MTLTLYVNLPTSFTMRVPVSVMYVIPVGAPAIHQQADVLPDVMALVCVFSDEHLQIEVNLFPFICCTQKAIIM